MEELLWLDRKNFDDVFLIVNGGFLGWITDSMHACYIAQNTNNELELVILFKNIPLEIDSRIIEEEILFSIQDSIVDCGIQKINYKSIIIEGTVAEFKEKGGGWISKYWPVFQKYDPMPYDLD